MNYKEWQKWKKQARKTPDGVIACATRDKAQVTFAKPSAKRAPGVTKSKVVTSVTSGATRYEPVVTAQLALSRRSFQDIMEKHGFERIGGYWV